MSKSKREKRRLQYERQKRSRARKGVAHQPVTARGHRSIGPKKGNNTYC